MSRREIGDGTPVADDDVETTAQLAARLRVSVESAERLRRRLGRAGHVIRRGWGWHSRCDFDAALRADKGK